ncbi:uncharacterized protein LY79DRAFT_658985 [Colletotrichum navitas]|uniref:Uncharacterized protein n=1 Tax=Colletotrichum navitas TaxID=681940 RepID=A0AAD8Q0E8_9PEZI|nr:uncharacterized protein LY79DRAFT_658985 [Colletotrichum navitas]KAK1593551.1 hypothetical protein LY79DRAFT_658985 [Colletotrichum navitas]
MQVASSRVPPYLGGSMCAYGRWQRDTTDSVVSFAEERGGWFQLPSVYNQRSRYEDGESRMGCNTRQYQALRSIDQAKCIRIVPRYQTEEHYVYVDEVGHSDHDYPYHGSGPHALCKRGKEKENTDTEGSTQQGASSDNYSEPSLRTLFLGHQYQVSTLS